MHNVHQLRLPSAKVRPEGRVGVNILFCVFHPFLNSPQNSEYFEHRHIGPTKKFPPAVCLKKNLRRLWRPQNPLFLTTDYKTMPLNFPLKHYAKGPARKMRKKCGKCGKMRTAPPPPLLGVCNNPLLAKMAQRPVTCIGCYYSMSRAGVADW